MGKGEVEEGKVILKVYKGVVQNHKNCEDVKGRNDFEQFF